MHPKKVGDDAGRGFLVNAVRADSGVRGKGRGAIWRLELVMPWI